MYVCATHLNTPLCTPDFSATRLILFILGFSFRKLFIPGGGMQSACLCPHAGQHLTVSLHPQKSTHPLPLSHIYNNDYFLTVYLSAIPTLSSLILPSRSLGMRRRSRWFIWWDPPITITSISTSKILNITTNWSFLVRIWKSVNDIKRKKKTT